VIKIAWCWNKNRYEDQWNIIKDLNMNPLSYAHLIVDKGTRNIQWRKDSLFTILLGKLDICLQKTKTRSMSFTLYKCQL
jgi:hypothetical protein